MISSMSATHLQFKWRAWTDRFIFQFFLIRYFAQCSDRERLKIFVCELSIEKANYCWRATKLFIIGVSANSLAGSILSDPKFKSFARIMHTTVNQLHYSEVLSRKTLKTAEAWVPFVVFGQSKRRNMYVHYWDFHQLVFLLCCTCFELSASKLQDFVKITVMFAKTF